MPTIDGALFNRDLHRLQLQGIAELSRAAVIAILQDVAILLNAKGVAAILPALRSLVDAQAETWQLHTLLATVRINQGREEPQKTAMSISPLFLSWLLT